MNFLLKEDKKDLNRYDSHSACLKYINIIGALLIEKHLGAIKRISPISCHSLQDLGQTFV